MIVGSCRRWANLRVAIWLHTGQQLLPFDSIANFVIGSRKTGLIQWLRALRICRGPGSYSYRCKFELDGHHDFGS